MPESYEALGAGSCDATLPVNEIVEEHTFGQFVTLSVTVQGEQCPINLLEARTATSNVHQRLRYMDYSVPLEAVVNNVFDDLANERTIRIVDDEALNRMLARGILEVDGKIAQAKLSSVTSAALLRGQPVSITAWTEDGPRLVRVVPPIARAQAPAVTRYVIPDLGAFVSNPNVPGINGLPFPLELTPELVGNLRNYGNAEVKANGQPVELFVNPLAKTEDNSWAAIASPYKAMTPTGLVPVRRWNGAHVALFLPWKQRWELLGYSRGILLHSLSLAPQEETTIEIFTWDRRKRTLEQESDTETEQSFERSDITKDTTDVINELTNSGEFQAQADARVKVTYPVVQVEVGGQLRHEEKVTQVAKRTAQHLAESISKAATRIKTLRKTKITETMETGREERVTRKVRNANMCHTLNLDYFEVVANYRIVTQFAEDDAAICVLIDMPSDIKNIELDNPRDCRIHEKALSDALLDRGLAAGFEAARLLASRDYAKDLVCDKVKCAGEPAAPPPTGLQPGPVVTPEQVPARVTTAFDDVLQAARTLLAMRYEPLMDPWKNGYEEPLPESVAAFSGWLYWALLARLIRRLVDVLTDAVNNRPADRRQAMQSVLNAIPEAGAVTQPGNLDEHQYKSDLDHIIWAKIWEYTDVFNAHWWWNTLGSHGALRPYDHGLAAALKRFQDAYREWQRTPQEAPGEDALHKTQEQQQVETDNDRLEYAYPLREVADAKERLDALLRHLMRHRSYYHYAILQAMPLGDQMQLLAEGDAPLDLCEPRVIGLIQGPRGAPDRIAVPLNLALLGAPDGAAGDRQALHELKTFVDKVLSNLRSTEGGARNVNLPTSGVMLESRLGRCDACENFIDQSRRIELEQRGEQVRALRATTALQEAEARRYEARLNAAPPQLDDPDGTADGVRLRLDPVRVTVEQPPRP